MKKLATPQISSAVNTVSGVKLTWNAVKGAARYRVFVKSGNHWKTIGNTVKNYFVHRDVVSGTRYTYTVRCLSADGKQYTSNYNPTGKTAVFVAAPRIASFADKQNGVYIKWNAVKGAVRYRLYRKNGDGWKKIADTAATSIIHTAAVPENAYTYTVRCLNAAGRTVSDYYPAGWTHRFRVPIGLNVPKITGCESTDNGMLIRWDSVKGAKKYRVFIKQNGEWSILGDTGKTAYRYADAPSGIPAAYSVCCISADGKAYQSRFDPNGFPFTYYKPPVLSVANTSMGPLLSWNRINGASAYRLLYRVNSGAWKTLTDSAEAVFVHTDAVDGTSYTYTVCCLDSDGNPVSAYAPAWQTVVCTRGSADALITRAAFAAEVAEILGAPAEIAPEPFTPLTRRHAAEILVNALGYTQHAGITLSDSDDDALAAAAYYGCFTPDGSGCILPDMPIVREEYDRLLDEVRRYAHLRGKRILAFGDSIMYGSGNNGSGISCMIAEKYGMEQVCCAVNGASFGVGNDCAHITDQIRKAYKTGYSADLILLNGGTNDMYMIKKGSAQDRFDPEVPEDSSFAGGMEYAMLLIRHYWGDTPVLYIRAHNMNLVDDTLEQQMGEYGLTLAAAWDAYTVDIYSDTGFNAELPEICERFTKFNSTLNRHDSVHPNALGYAVYYLPLIGEKLAAIL